MNNDLNELKMKDEQRQKRGSIGDWGVGVVVIIVGVVVLINQTTSLNFENWWAIFMLVPVLYFGARVWDDVKSNGRLSPAGRGALIGGLATLIIPVIFLFNLNWGILWPLTLILGGIAMIVSRN